MKFAKKIFVGIIAVAMLVSCFAIASYAEAPVRPVEKFESVLEYMGKATYLVEDYETQEGTDYVFVPSHTYTDVELGEVPYFEFVKSDKATVTVVGESGNKYLSISNDNSDSPIGYKFSENGGYGYLVTSFDFKLGDAGATNGADVFVKATLGDYFDDVTLFAANTSDDNNMEFLYSEYNSDRVTYSTVKADAVPELGAWYHVALSFSPAGGIYWVKVTKGDEVVLSFEDTIDDSAVGIDSVRIYVSDSANAGATKTYVDNIAVYEGTAVRDVINSAATLADLAVKIDEYGRHEATPIAEKVEVADFYALFYGDSEGSYVAPDDAPNKAELDAIRANAEAFRNQTYLLALETYAGAVAEVDGYYAKLDYIDKTVQRFYDVFKDFDGETAIEGLDNEKVEKVLDSYNAVTADLEETRLYSEAFARALEDGYDAKNKDFAYMQLKYASISTLVDEIALEYKYSDVKADTKYPTLADAKAEYDALEAKILLIVNNASEIFIPAVEAMDNTQVEAVSKAAPYLTVDFEVLYQNYLTASSVYSNGTVCEGLDPATYPGLTDAIAEYLAYEEYIQSRIAECDAFIQAIRAVESSTYYKTMVEQLANAALYLDDNKEKSLEKHAGVEAAVALYDSLVEKLENSKKAADAYIAAVNAIDVNASYAALKASVGAARALKEAGALIGYTGVAEADIKFAEADAKLSVLEGHSSTLLYAIEALKTADTLAERRELIFIALNAKDGAEENIAGVTAARAELENYIKKYNEDVARVNALFAGVVGSTTSSISSVAPSDGVIISAEVIEALLK